VRVLQSAHSQEWLCYFNVTHYPRLSLVGVPSGRADNGNYFLEPEKMQNRSGKNVCATKDVHFRESIC
jgi:hypothetical protein